MPAIGRTRWGAALLLAACSAGGCAAPPFDFASLGGRVIDEPFEKPGVVFRDTDGKPFDVRRGTEGFVTVVVMGYTRCPDVCPNTMAALAAAIADLAPTDQARIRVLFASVDRRDTPAELRNFLDHFDRRFVGLVGDSAQLADLARGLGMTDPWVERSDSGSGEVVVAHSVFVPVFTRDNRAHLLYPAGTPRATWRRDLPRLVAAGAR